MTIGEKIQEARKKAGISQLELAARMNTKSAAISQWEGNKRIPKSENMIKIADALGTEIAELLMLPPEINRERVRRAAYAVCEAGKQLESCKQDGASADAVAEAEKVFTATHEVLDALILPAILEHQSDLAQRRAQAAASHAQEDIFQPLPEEAQDTAQAQEDFREMLWPLIHQTVHSQEDGEALARLISEYKKLNDAGRAELIRRAEEMTYVPAYDK
ncbi:MAG: helix-turn-helix domain-containing protein [Lachnospiraceae bacterium]|nr:helix-turn-helix domain-containing protein [Lachnospiraceae bacterium]